MRGAAAGERAVRASEGGHINKSLLVLSTVIQKLSEPPGKGGVVPHIPFRSSKITRILQVRRRRTRGQPACRSDDNPRG